MGTVLYKKGESLIGHNPGMERLKKRLSRTRSNDSVASSIGSTVSKGRGRRGGLATFHFKKANFTKELTQALKTGDATKLRELLENGTDIDDFEEVEKAVRACCEKGYLELLAILIRFGASVNSLGDSNMGPLHIAVRHGSLSIITLLLSNGANISLQTKFEKRSPLHIAALAGKEDSMKHLMEASKSADLNIRDLYGTTPLHMAARMGHTNIVRLLLESKRKCDVNMYDNEGWTALHLAAERGDTEMAQLLMDNHAQVDSQNKYGRTPLHWAVIKGDPVMTKFLTQYKASTSLKDLHGKCALQYATDPAVKQILQLVNRSLPPKANDSLTPSNSIGQLLKIDPRESFIKRIGQPLPCVVTQIANVRKRSDAHENLDTIVEETEAGSSSRKSSILSDDEAFSDESFTKEKSPFVRAIFQRKNSNGSSATSSRRNSTNSKSDLESSYKSTTSSKLDPLTRVSVDYLESVPSMKSIAEGWNSQDLDDDDDVQIPEEALLGKMQFRTMLKRIQRHQQLMENVINSVSTDVAQAVTGRKALSNEDMLNVSNRLHKLQDMMFDFREENDRQATIMKTTMQSFLDTIKQRLSPRDPVPVWILHAFLHACSSYLATQENGWKQIIQRTPAISEDKKGKLLSKCTSMSEDSRLERSTLVIQFVIKSLLESDSNKNMPLKALLVLITKCSFEPNSAQIILKNFIHTARSNPEESLQHENLFALSYRLGKDGESLGSHLGVPVNDTDGGSTDGMSQSHRQDQNLRMLSKWRQATAKARTVECVYDLVEGLVVIGREDLLVWILAVQTKRSLSSVSS